MGMHDEMATAHPKLARGRVWCLECGATVKVATAKCLREGWPKCCGYTMSLDSPQGRPLDAAPAAALR